MTVRVSKQPVNLREKLSELERPIGLKGSDLMRAETAQDARDFVSAGRKNLIINGKLQISQRGDFTSNLLTTGTQSKYYLDRWYQNGNDGTEFQHKLDQTVNEYIVNTFYYTAPTGSIWPSFGQQIEDKNWKHLKGKYVTLSVWVKSNFAKVGVRFYTGIQNIGPRHSGSGQWEYITWTFRVPNNATNLYPLIDSYDGSASHLMSGQYVEFTMMQVEEGQNATEFEHRLIGEELALCQRYYEENKNTQYSATGYHESFIRSGMQFQVSKRAAPNVIVTSASNSAGSSLTLSVGNANTMGFNYSMNSTGTSYGVRFNYTADAEL